MHAGQQVRELEVAVGVCPRRPRGSVRELEHYQPIIEAGLLLLVPHTVPVEVRELVAVDLSVPVHRPVVEVLDITADEVPAEGCGGVVERSHARGHGVVPCDRLALTDSQGQGVVHDDHQRQVDHVHVVEHAVAGVRHDIGVLDDVPGPRIVRSGLLEVDVWDEYLHASVIRIIHGVELVVRGVDIRNIAQPRSVLLLDNVCNVPRFPLAAHQARERRRPVEHRIVDGPLHRCVHPGRRSHGYRVRDGVIDMRHRRVGGLLDFYPRMHDVHDPP